MCLSSDEEKFELPFSELYSERGRFRWCENLTEAENILSTLILDRSIEEFVSYHPYYKTVLQGWSLQNLAESTLYFYLEDKFKRKKEYKEPLINSYDWKLITNLILNSFISKQIIEFIQFLDLLKISPTQKIIAGSFQSVDNITFLPFEDCIFDEKGLRNLLSFFNLENIYIDYIIHKTFETKNIKIVAIFLSDLNVSGDQGLVLTKALEKFIKFVNTNENFIKKSAKISTKNHYKNSFEKRRDDLIELQYADLENFDVFDIFDSSEAVKSKASNILLYSFYDNFYDNLTTLSKSETKELISLFESFLLAYDTNVLLLQLPEIEVFINKFLLEKKEVINSFVEKNNLFFAKFLKEMPLTEIIICVIFIGTFIIRPLGYSPRSQAYLPRTTNAPFAMITNFGLRASGPVKSESASSVSIVDATSLAKASPVSNIRQVRRKAARSIVQTRSSISASAKATALINLKKTGEQKTLADFNEAQSVIIAGEVEQVLQARRDNKNHSTVLANVNSRSVVDFIDGVPTFTNQYNSLGSSMRYGEGPEFKKEFNGLLVSHPEGPLQLDPVSVDFEHVTPEPLRRGYNMRTADGGTHVFLSSHHRAFTKEMIFNLGIQYGYTGDKLNAIDFTEDSCVVYVKKLGEFYEVNPDKADELTRYGIDVEQVQNGAKCAFNLDTKFLVEMNIPNGSILAVSHIELAHGQAIKEFDAFPTRSLSSQHDAKTSCRLLEEGLLRVKPILIHYDAIAPSLETGTVADLRSADKNNKLRNSIGEAITFTENLSGQNLSHLRESVLNKDSILSLEQAEEIARTDLGLDFVQKGVKPIWRPSTFKYPRK